MAFSAHNEMGQNERVEAECSTASRGRTRLDSDSKFIPNPSAQPFVPKWNSSPSARLNDISTQNAAESFIFGTEKDHMDRAALLSMNGMAAPTPPCVSPSKHIALHLLSKVLDDETIFSLEEGNATGEAIVPLSVDPDIRPHDPCSWPFPSPQPSPECAPDPDQQQQLSSSIPGEHIWYNSDVNHNAAMTTSPITTPNILGWVAQAQNSAPACINGFPESLPSPQMSTSVDSLGGNCGYYCSQYCSPTLPDEWTMQAHSDSEASREGIEQTVQYDYSRASPVHPTPVGLVCLSGSWPQKSIAYGEFSPASSKSDVDNTAVVNGYCISQSWKGSSEGAAEYQPGRRPQYRRSTSWKSDDDSWMGKESLVSSGTCARQVPSNELHIRLDQCYEQLRYLEKERHKAELEISKYWPTRRVSSSGSNSSSRLHYSPSRVDRLLSDVGKEHGKVEALVGRIERIRHSPLNINISESVDDMMACIRRLQSCRKDEINNLSGRTKSTTGPSSPDTKDIVSLVSGVRDLAICTRRCRTAVWCASQLALGDLAKMQATPSPRSRRHSSNSSESVEPSSPRAGVA